MNNLRFTFHFLPSEDRLALVFQKEAQKIPTLLLTRRLVKILSTHLRKIQEKKHADEGHSSELEKRHIMDFNYEAFVQDHNVQTESSHQQKHVHLQNPVLPTRIDFTPEQGMSILSFYRLDTFLVSIRMDGPTLQQIYHALAAMSARAEWDLEDAFGLRPREETGGMDGTGYVS